MTNLILNDAEKQLLLDVLSFVDGEDENKSPFGIANDLLCRLGGCDHPEDAPFNGYGAIINTGGLSFLNYSEMSEDARKSYGR